MLELLDVMHGVQASLFLKKTQCFSVRAFLVFLGIWELMDSIFFLQWPFCLVFARVLFMKFDVSLDVSLMVMSILRRSLLLAGVEF